MSDSEREASTSIDISSEKILKAGWLSKQGGGHKSVKKRWFVFTKTAIQYFKSDKMGDPLGTVYIRRVTGVRKTEDPKGPNAFELDTPERVYVFYAPSPEEQKLWVDLVQSILPPKVQKSGLQVIKTGYLTKQGGVIKSWKRRWFVLRKDKLLSYYMDDKDPLILGTIDISSCTDVKAVPYSLYNRENVFVVDTPDRSYPVFASSKAELESWVSVLLELIKSEEENTGSKNSNDVDDDEMNPEEISKLIDLKSKITKEGHLVKQGGRIKTWKRRWFVLREATLAYYKEKSDEYPIGLIKLSDCKSFSLASEKVNRPFSFEIVTSDRTYFCSAIDSDEMWGWINVLGDSLNKASQIKNNQEFMALRRVSQIATKNSEIKVQVLRKATAKKFKQVVSRYNAKKLNKSEQPWRYSENGNTSSWAKDAKDNEDSRRKELKLLESEKEKLVAQLEKMEGDKKTDLEQQISLIEKDIRKIHEHIDKDEDESDEFELFTPIGYAQASMDYTPNAYDEDALQFLKGDIIVVTEKESSGNWKGRVVKKDEKGNAKYSPPGNFPCRYVEDIDKPDFIVDREGSIEVSLTLEDKDWQNKLDDAATNLFQLYDGDGDGFVTKMDFFEFLYEFGKTHLTDQQVDQCWDVLDREKSGKVDSESFRLGIKKLDEVDFFQEKS